MENGILLTNLAGQSSKWDPSNVLQAANHREDDDGRELKLYLQNDIS